MAVNTHNTGVVARSYNNRGLITHNATTNALVRQSDGTLWAAVRENHPGRFIKLFRSVDSGFSWQRMWEGTFSAVPRRTGVAGLNQNGPFMFLQVYEKHDRVILWHTYFDTSTSQYNLEPFVWRLSDNPMLRLDSDDVGEDVVGQIFLDNDQLAFAAPYNGHVTWILYTNFGTLKVKQYYPHNQLAAAWEASATGSYFNSFGACADKAGFVDVVIATEETLRKLKYLAYSSASGSFSAPVTVYEIGGALDAVDITVSRDGYGNLLTLWSQHTTAGTAINVMYSITKDGGATWSAATTIAPSAGHGPYHDAPTGEIAARTTSLGGRTGFILSYVRDNSAAVPKTFVRTLTSSDGVTYTLGAEHEIATEVATAAEPVTGLRFFQPPGDVLLDISDPGQVRVAYQVDEGASTVQTDVRPVTFGQELLSLSAYVTPLASESGSYTVEGAIDNQLLVTVNVLAGLNEMVDYYALELTGHATLRYMSAFEKVGNALRFLRYDPITDSEMADRSAYGAPVEHTSLALIDEETYKFPLADKGFETFTSYIERDVRKLYLPPNFALTRDQVVNKGNYLKRTVWTVEFSGNSYEISQVVPHFLDDQITHYSANCYVIGPSNDPFSRRTLPSET